MKMQEAIIRITFITLIACLLVTVVNIILHGIGLNHPLHILIPILIGLALYIPSFYYLVWREVRKEKR